MPSPWRWPVPPLYTPSQAGPDDATRRPCGCRIDSVVFGCPHTPETGGTP